MPSFINSPAARQYRANLQLFRGLTGQPRGFKLAYDPASGSFSVQGKGIGTAVKRTFSTTDQSVTSEENFAQPVRDVFGEAVLANVPDDQLTAALNGLKALGATYQGDAAKAAALRKVLGHVEDLLHGHTPLRHEFLDAYRRANPETLFSPEDRAFLHRLFSDGDVMSFPITHADQRDQAGDRVMPRLLAKRLYDKYNEVREGPRIQDTAAWVGNLPRKLNPYLQNHGHKLAAVSDSVITNKNSMGTDFIYYSTTNRRHGQTWRIYLNFRADAAGAILTTLTTLRREYDIDSFKITGPHAFHARSDKVVVYVNGRQKAQALAAELHRRFAGQLVDPLPALTLRLYAGVALGIEPRRVVIGFGTDKAGQHSYGTVRAELLASAVLHYLDNRSRLIELLGMGNGAAAAETAFQKCAAVAFEGYERYLNPDGIAH